MLFQIDGEAYALDLNKISEFVFSSHNDKNSETSISEVYAKTDEEIDDNSKLKLISKEISENRLNGNNGIDTIKYDLVRQLLEIVMNIGETVPKNNGMFVEQTIDAQKNGSFENLSVGEMIAFNTFINEGFLINV